jgi:3-oxoacyl-[acyl-carrier protein] reductase
MGIFTDQVAVVTGASRGIGKAIAVALGREGAHIAAVAQNPERLDALKAEFEGQGIACSVWPLSLRDSAAASETIGKIATDRGRLDILVNNAGITRDGLLMRMSDEQWNEVIEVNLRGAYACAKAALKPMMKARSGRIVNITSVVGLMGQARQTNYAASKAGLVGFTKALAREVASRNITVNAIAPGFIVSDMTGALNDEQQEKIKSQIPLGRFGAAEDIAATVAFLAGPSGAYITGETIRVDGGLYI